MRKIIAVVGLVVCLASAVFAATSVSYYGITWTFSADRPVGTFVNGEPWVVGPVTVTTIDPNPSQSVDGVQHGSMINPIPNTNFGFDSHPQIIREIVYESAKNAALLLPLTLQVGDVLVSSRSNVPIYYPTWLKTICALTVLSGPPPTGSFRPGIFGTDRTVKWNVSQLDWSVLKNYDAVSWTPTKSEIEAKMPPLPWFEWAISWSGNSLQADDNTSDDIMLSGADSGHYRVYGRETAAKFGEVGLWLNTNQPLADKQAIAIQMVQNGIDVFEYVQHGGGFLCDGGHKCGRKLPLVLAAMMLNDQELKTMAGDPTIFQEDQQIWFVNQSDVGRTIWMPQPGDSWYGREFLQYTQADVGKAEWGIRHSRAPEEDNASWSATYRSTVGNGMLGPWLAAYLMGAQAAWNWPAAFAYMERYVATGGYYGGATYAQTKFNEEMWKAYWNKPPGVRDGSIALSNELAVQVYPNPMRDRVTFTLPEKSNAIARVEILGRDGRVVFQKQVETVHELSLQWDGMDSRGQRMGPGLFFYKVITGPSHYTGKIILQP